MTTNMMTIVLDYDDYSPWLNDYEYDDSIVLDYDDYSPRLNDYEYDDYSSWL